MSALNTAVKRKLLTLNPAAHVELPTARRPKAVVWTPEGIEAWRRTGRRPAVAVWTPEQTGAFLDVATGHRLSAMFQLIAYRGLRRGEAVGLRWEDVDLTGKSLTIGQQVIQLGWQTEVGAPKTDSGTRTVPLDQVSIAALRAWRVVQDHEAMAWGQAWQHTGLVFTREDGTALHPAAVTDAFHDISAAAGLPPIRLHDLRHTAASLALQAGVPMKVVSEQLGHSSLAITADTYTSVLPVVAHAAAEAVAGLVPRTTRPATDDAVGPSQSTAFGNWLSVRPKGARNDRRFESGRGKAAGQWGWAPRGSNPQPADLRSTLAIDRR
jgi:integrase